MLLFVCFIDKKDFMECDFVCCPVRSRILANSVVDKRVSISLQIFVQLVTNIIRLHLNKAVKLFVYSSAGITPADGVKVLLTS